MGLTFLGLAVVAVLLQAWLWAPRFWDAENRKSRAPRAWTTVHRVVGFAYVAIYVVMTWHMVPRLWQYQFELPARTVVHALAAIMIGVLLLTKLAILRWFRHFEEAMPRLGFGLLACTVVLTVLSVPHALRAHDLGRRTADPQNVARVRDILARLSFDPSAVDGLTTTAAFRRGRSVLVHDCTRCHDLRTILSRPRTGRGWQRVVDRMLEKPLVFGESLSEEDAPFVTAYLIAITPDLQSSAKRRVADAREVADRARALEEAGESEAAGASAADPARLVADRCTECHDLTEVEEHGGDTRDGWLEVVTRMVADEGAELSPAEARAVVDYLVATWPPETEE